MKRGSIGPRVKVSSWTSIIRVTILREDGDERGHRGKEWWRKESKKDEKSEKGQEEEDEERTREG